MCSSVAAIEAMVVDLGDGVGTGAMEQQFLVVCVLVLLLQEFLSYLVVFPQ
jgi:hypothetical protein